MDNTRQMLAETYLACWGRLRSRLIESHVDLHTLSDPFLIDVMESYQGTSVKVLFVGKETCGWGRYTDHLNRKPREAVRDLQRDYIAFRREGRWEHTPFWRAARIIYDRLNPDGPEGGYMTTNLIKMDQNNTKPSPEVEEMVCSEFPLLPYEIEALQPDVVIFFTGPSYDDRLKRTFPGAVFEPVEDLAPNVLSRIRHEQLPYHSYRTYHPGYTLRGRKAKEEKFDPMVDAIVRQATTTK